MVGEKKLKARCLKAGRAAEYVGVSRRYLHDLAAQGRIPYHRIGPRCFVFDVADLDAFLDSCRIGGMRDD